jgi:hypothetical protein
MVHASLSLIDLPPELVYDISDFLPPDAILALKLTHRNLDVTLPLAPRFKDKPLSDCARLAVRTYLASPNPQPSHLRCILCKAVYPVNQFKSSSSPACVPVSFTEDTQQTEIVQLPQRLCSWHIGRLSRVVHTEPCGRNEWTSHMDKMCMHCGAIQSWAECECSCDSCPIRPVRTYTRYLNNPLECRRFLFWKDGARLNTHDLQDDEQEQLMVRETCWNPSKSKPCLCRPWLTITGTPTKSTIINLPIKFEDRSPPVRSDHVVCPATSRPQDRVDALLGPPRHR